MVSDDAYDNPWLGLHVVKPAAMTFVKPGRSLAEQRRAGHDRRALLCRLRLSATDPTCRSRMWLRAALTDTLGGAPTGTPENVVWNGAPAVRFTRGGRQRRLQRAKRMSSGSIDVGTECRALCSTGS